MLMVDRILLLAYRNLVAAIDRIFLIWQIAFPVVYIFVAGYAYSAMIGDQGISLGSLTVSYTSFLTAGMIGFNVMNGSTSSWGHYLERQKKWYVSTAVSNAI